MPIFYKPAGNWEVGAQSNNVILINELAYNNKYCGLRRTISKNIPRTFQIFMRSADR
jgi:hypothetical protein